MTRSGPPVIRRLSLLDGAASAKGLAVVIDVFRAGTFSCYALGLGAARLFPTASLEEARRLKRANPGWILAGERRGVPPHDFDMGNSPFLLLSAGVAGKTIIHATSAGTRGVVASSTSSSSVCMACFANAGAVARYIRDSDHGTVSLVSMGEDGIRPAPEDELCAGYLEGLISGDEPVFEDYASRIIDSGAGRRFIESTDPGMPPQDLEACLSLDRFTSVPVLSVSLEGLPCMVDAGHRNGMATPISRMIPE